MPNAPLSPPYINTTNYLELIPYPERIIKG